MADDDIVVEIEKDAIVPDKEVTVDPADDLKAQHDQLKAETEREIARRKQAQRETAVERQARLAAEQEVATVRTEITETKLGTVESGLSAAQTELAAAKAEYISAQEAGDWKRAADAQERIADATARKVRLDEAKSDLEIAKTKEPLRPKTQPEKVADDDPIEAFITGPVDSQGNTRAPAAQAWLREHTDFISDPRKLKKLSAADMDAQAEGIAVNSPEYFAHVETFLGLRKEAPDKTANGNGAVKPAQRRTSPPVAPVQNSAGGINGGGDVVRLTAGEAKAATDGTHVWNYDDPSGQKKFKKGEPIGVQEFARRKKAMRESGLYDRTFVEQ